MTVRDQHHDPGQLDHDLMMRQLRHGLFQRVDGGAEPVTRDRMVQIDVKPLELRRRSVEIRTPFANPLGRNRHRVLGLRRVGEHAERRNDEQHGMSHWEIASFAPR